MSRRAVLSELGGCIFQQMFDNYGHGLRPDWFLAEACEGTSS